MPKRFLLGYQSVGEMIEGTLLLKYSYLNTFAGIIGLLGVYLLKLSDYIYDSRRAVALLLAIMLIDWITGALRAHRNDEFHSFKFQRMILNIVVAYFLIGFTFQFSKELLIFQYVELPVFIWAGFTTTYFLSVLENLHAMGYVPDKVHFYTKRMLNIDRLIKSYFQHKLQERNPEPEPNEPKES